MLQKLGTPGTFATYAVMCVVTIFFIRATIPETKNELLEKIRVGGPQPGKISP